MNKAVACASRKGKYTSTIPLGEAQKGYWAYLHRTKIVYFTTECKKIYYICTSGKRYFFPLAANLLSLRDDIRPQNQSRHPDLQHQDQGQSRRDQRHQYRRPISCQLCQHEVHSTMKYQSRPLETSEIDSTTWRKKVINYSKMIMIN
jgi:hypothetical protein